MATGRHEFSLHHETQESTREEVVNAFLDADGGGVTDGYARLCVVRGMRRKES